ncbi:hypothetical protein H0H92_007948, partial [Tricholoma furcatifolium]
MPSKGVALITGAGQGIGRAIALRLAEDGFDVAINDIPAKLQNLESLADEIKLKHQQRKCYFHVADVTVEEQVKSLIAGVVELHGSLDVVKILRPTSMIANAGIARHAPLLETSEEDWDRIFSVNAKGTFFCYKHAGAQMISQGRGGRIIGASSVSGKKGRTPLGKTKNPSNPLPNCRFQRRGGILRFEVCPVEFGPSNITVNAYAPGPVETSMRAMGPTQDIAGLVSYLASEEAGFITGRSVSEDVQQNENHLDANE